MKLAPRMIQSMEILQMAAQALEARIAQELANNPTLELREPGQDAEDLVQQREQDQRDSEDRQRELVVEDDAGGSGGTHQADDFERLTNISEEYGDSWDANTYETPDSYHPPRASAGERDVKMDAMANTAARSQSLTEQLLAQWSFAETEPAIDRAGQYLIGFIDDDGYLRTDRQTLVDQTPSDVTPEDLDAALVKLQEVLEPVGLAARDLRECLLLQIDAKVRQQQEGRSRNGDNGHHEDHGLAAARLLVSSYLRDIETNRLPNIAKSTGLTIDQIKAGIAKLRQFTPHPGRSLVDERPAAITPDAIIEYDEEQDRYVARLRHERSGNIHISRRYMKMAKDTKLDKQTREFVGNNLRSAQWLIDALKQRQSTLLRVINVVLQAQRDFFDQGPQYLKPLPMTQVADQLGLHVATVSRAVSDKYLQTPRGIFPLRMFFSGGTETDTGEQMSWAAIQAKLEQIIDEEDKNKPLNDDQLVEKLHEHGIEIARRTVAKYRKQLNIPPARQRREF